ncbi:hypothetical protein [Sphingomonas sp. URHD0057]|nr:hypothetical protein [Sphingomonas sp. URHD0057]
MAKLVWLVPIGALIIFALWQFVRGTGPRKLPSREEEQRNIEISGSDLD